MAAVTLTAEASARTGNDLNFVAPDAVDGIEFNNANHKGILLVRNLSASPITVTIQITKLVDGLAIPDRTVSVPAGAISAIGPFNDVHNQSDGFVRATFSAVAQVTAALLTLGALN